MYTTCAGVSTLDGGLVKTVGLSIDPCCKADRNLSNKDSMAAVSVRHPVKDVWADVGPGVG